MPVIGLVTEVTEDYELTNENSFSIMESSRTKFAHVLLGPVRFINHDCKPNVEVSWQTFEKIYMHMLCL